MNKEEFRKHCEDQIERCIKFHDSKHLKEHELSLALLNECETRKQNQENLIKYIEDKIIYLEKLPSPRGVAMIRRDELKDLLERIKNNDWN